jgi:tetratricopeptide (TPR) repeat protein
MPEPSRSIYRGRALLALRRIDAAVDAFNQALSADASSAAARIGLAETNVARGRAQDALAELAEVLRSQPNNAEALLVRGRVLVAQGRFTDAQTALTAALQQRDALTLHQQVILFAALSEAQLAHGELDKATDSLNALAQLANNAPATLILSARIKMAQQDYPGASAELQRILMAMPDFTSARFLLGAALLAQGNLYQAESHLNRVVQQSPENLEARKLLARVRLRLDQPDAAMQTLLPAGGRQRLTPK